MNLTEIEKFWGKYLGAERDGLRSEYMRLLDELVVALLKLEAGDRKGWAYELSRMVVDEEASITVRFPLFRKVLFPALLEGHLAGDPGCARWLAGFSQLLYKSSECQAQLPPEERTEIGLLMAARLVDPEDGLARGKLIKATAWQFEYSLHELPTGVLYGSNGATREECEEQEAWLADFENLIREHGCELEYIELVSQCRFHFREYPVYLARMGEFGSYSEYLSRGRSV